MIRIMIMAISFCMVTYGAFAEVHSNCATVAAADGEIDGQNHTCGQCRANGFKPTGCVKCGSVSINIMPGEHIIDTSRTVDDIRWAAWLDDININSQSNGMTVVSTSLKNWEDDSPKRICLKVQTD